MQLCLEGEQKLTQTHRFSNALACTMAAYLAKKGVNVLGGKWYRILVALFGVVLIFFGTSFVVSVLTT